MEFILYGIINSQNNKYGVWCEVLVAVILFTAFDGS